MTTGNLFGAPFAEWIEAKSPKGAAVRIWGQGDEYSARFEAADGHAVVYDSKIGAYAYARKDAASGALVTTGIAVGDETPADLAALAGIPLHERDVSEAFYAKRKQRIEADESNAETRQRWQDLKMRQQQRRRYKRAIDKGEGTTLKAPPSSPTMGKIVGVTLLIDFPTASDGSGSLAQDVHPGVTKADLEQLVNGENFNKWGNASSVREYYADVSGGNLVYTNIVLGWFKAAHPRSYYDDSTQSCGTCARPLIGEILEQIAKSSEYSSKYLPLLQQVSYSGSYFKALNVFFAGPKSPVWDKGLWAHKSTLGSTYYSKLAVKIGTATKYFYTYQISPVTESPSIGTFCHENGHMICGFPDLYSYEDGGGNGVGSFCLMCSHGSVNPQYVCAYLRAAAGWVMPQEMPTGANVLSASSRLDDVWSYSNPEDDNQYFLVENRQRRGRDSCLPGGGVLIWRCDENGNSTDSSPLSGFSGMARYRRNYELSLEQADGLYELEREINEGQAADCWHRGNSKSGLVFSDATEPCAKWKNGSSSGLVISGFSENDDVMTFHVGEVVTPSYTIDYLLGGGTFGASHPSEAMQGEAFCVSAPTRGNDAFLGWSVSGLDNPSAKWGTASNPGTTISSAATRCKNGVSGNVYFKDLATKDGAHVTLIANWRPASDPVETGNWYVAAGWGSDANAGTSWSAPFATLQKAVTAASSSARTIVVYDGQYEPFESTKNIYMDIRSVSGAERTIVDGSLQWSRGVTNRCAKFYSNYQTMTGFTLLNGRIPGGYGGGSYFGTLSNCIYRCNSARYGGGAYSGVQHECLFRDNAADYGGGGYKGDQYGCQFDGNAAEQSGGGSYGGVLHGCLLHGNVATWGGGCYTGTLWNCTLSLNSAVGYGGGVHKSKLRNCIVWDNMASTVPNAYNSDCSYTCSMLLEGGVGNMSADPKFVDAGHGDFRLMDNSPCINAGANQYVDQDKDLDGNPRIRGGVVDMGVYEWQTAVTVRPVNDNFANATAISGASGSLTASSENATREAGEPHHGTSGATNSLWWKWTALAAGSMTITTEGSGFDTGLGVYTGSPVTNLDKIDDNDNVVSGATWSSVTFSAVAGTTYYIAVAGRQGATGSVKLNWNFSGAAIASPTITGYGGYTTYTYIEWNSVSGATGYKIYRSTSSGSRPSAPYATVVPSKTVFCDYDGTPGVTYYYWLSAVGSSGEGVSGPVSTYRRANFEKLSPTTLSFGASGGVTSVVVSANASWQATKPATATWLTLSKTGGNAGTLNVTATANSSSVQRDASITLTAASGTDYPVKRTITVSQSAQSTVSLATALDNTTLSFTTGGDANWFGQGEVTHDGADAAQSGPITNSQSSWMRTTVTGPGTVSFWWYVSSESVTWDYLAFSIDGVQTNKIGGTSCSWTQCSYNLSAGNHVLEWTYLKDGSFSSGLDAGFVDQVVWTPSTGPKTLYVSKDGSDGQLGTSASEALATIQRAVDLAQDGDEILVLDGRYEPIDTANKAITIRSANGADFTFIDGALQWSRGLTNRCARLGTSPSSANALMIGFTLTNGRGYGGGGVCYGRLRDCRIVDNVATNGGGAFYSNLENCELSGNVAMTSGGGTYYSTQSNCELSGNVALSSGGGAYSGTQSNCTFDTNQARWGGGAYGGTQIRCRFSANRAGTYGGGSNSGNLQDCTLEGNVAVYGGGGTCNGVQSGCDYLDNEAENGGGAYNGTQLNCLFDGNEAGENGGGSYNGTNSVCRFVENHAKWGGGLIYGRSERCVLVENHADNSGGGAYDGNLSNCLILGNDAKWGGGSYTGRLSNCTLSRNVAANYGGGAHGGNLFNCIAWGNTCSSGKDVYSSTCAYTCSGQSLSGTGNITADPQFVDADDDDFRIAVTSPCRNGGSNAYAAGSVDYAGNPRIFDGVVDMGAFECTQIPRPPNDDFSDATVLSGASGGVEGANTCATYEQGEPLTSRWSWATNTVWWIWTAPSNGIVQVDTFGSDFDTELGVYTGSTLSSLFRVEVGDDSSDSRLTSACVFESVAGTQYRIVVAGGYRGAAGTIRLNWRYLPSATPFVGSGCGHYGLFVGINRYVLEGCGTLTCCEKDIDAMRTAGIQHGGWTSDACRRLANEAATKANVRAQLASLSEVAKLGDTVLFYQSSHGGQKTSTSKEVCLCMYDKEYWDYELAEDLAQFRPGVKLVVVVDACHSGGLFKDKAAVERFELAARVMEIMRSRTLVETKGPRRIDPEEIGWISAADYNQTSQGGSTGSEFTMAMVDAWKDDAGAADLDGDRRLDFYDLFKAAELVGAKHGAVGQCANESVLKAVTARLYSGYVQPVVVEVPGGESVSIPGNWFASGKIDGRTLFDPARFASLFGTDYAAAAKMPTGKVDAHGNPLYVWQDFVAGTDPTDKTSEFKASISLEDGKPVITWAPDLNEGGTRSIRTYRTLGINDLSHSADPAAWREVAPGNESAYKFFKVEVDLK